MKPGTYVSEEHRDAMAPEAVALMDAAEAFSAEIQPGRLKMISLAMGMQAIIREASKRQTNDGDIIDALANVVATSTLQTSNPQEAGEHFIHALILCLAKMTTALNEPVGRG